jgi:hypothetical protein
MFCTYYHSKPNGNVFYIGIGNKKRPYDFNKRNNHWKNIVSKYGNPQVKVLAEWDTAEEAKQHEILLISCFKDMGYKLANLTVGGDGCNGYKHTEEHKQKLAERVSGKGNPMYGKFGSKNPNYGNGKKITGGLHPRAIKIKYKHEIFSCIKDLANRLDMPYKKLTKRVKTNANKYGYEVLK